jgi:hypothetical protein
MDQEYCYLPSQGVAFSVLGTATLPSLSAFVVALNENPDSKHLNNHERAMPLPTSIAFGLCDDVLSCIPSLQIILA